MYSGASSNEKYSISQPKNMPSSHLWMRMSRISRLDASRGVYGLLVSYGFTLRSGCGWTCSEAVVLRSGTGEVLILLISIAR